MKNTQFETRIERILAAPLAIDAIRRWPQSGEVIRSKARISRVEAHFKSFNVGITRRHSCGDVIAVEWSADYGDGRVFRNVSIGELRDGEVVCVTDYWGEPFTPAPWRTGLSEPEDVRPHADELAPF